MQTILVPIDGSLHALKALHIAGDLAEKYGGMVLLLHVLAEGKTAAEILKLPVAKNFPPNMVEDLKQMSAALSGQQLKFIGEKILHEATQKTQRRGIEVKQLALAAGDPVEAILLAAKAEAVNTIVIGCRGVSAAPLTSENPALENMSMGSVSNNVFARATCTCISVK